MFTQQENKRVSRGRAGRRVGCVVRAASGAASGCLVMLSCVESCSNSCCRPCSDPCRRSQWASSFGAEAQMGLKVQPTHCRTCVLPLGSDCWHPGRGWGHPTTPIKFEYSIVFPEIIWKNRISCTRINKYARNAIRKLRVLKFNWILLKYLHETKISWIVERTWLLNTLYTFGKWRIVSLLRFTFSLSDTAWIAIWRRGRYFSLLSMCRSQIVASFVLCLQIEWTNLMIDLCGNQNLKQTWSACSSHKPLCQIWSL